MSLVTSFIAILYYVKSELHDSYHFLCGEHFPHESLTSQKFKLQVQLSTFKKVTKVAVKVMQTFMYLDANHGDRVIRVRCSSTNITTILSRLTQTTGFRALPMKQLPGEN